MDLPTNSKKVCSPVHQCFPPGPTVCLICKQTSVDECPFEKGNERVSDEGE